MPLNKKQIVVSLNLSYSTTFTQINILGKGMNLFIFPIIG